MMKREQLFIFFFLICCLWGSVENVQAQKRMSADEAQKETEMQVEKWLNEIRRDYGNMWEMKTFVIDSLRMPILYKVFGECPP